MSKQRPPWNMCDVCGKFVAMDDFENGLAVRRLVYPDSQFTVETFETLCKEHAGHLTTGKP